jgi:alpha-1,3-mannosyltransferase
MNRIKVLADYRNLALKSLYTIHPSPQSIIFINDIYVCSYQILELLYQYTVQNADMTCGFDWEANGMFYDAWVSREMTGHLFFDISDDGYSFNPEMFPHVPVDQARYHRGEPFQVYSCWNGMVVMNPVPFLERSVKFRRSRRNECAASEATLIAKDFWTHNFSRIMIVPSVNVAYNLDAARLQQERTVSKTLWNGPVAFSTYPPEKVACRAWPEEAGLGASPGRIVWTKPVDDLEELAKHAGEEDGLLPNGNYPVRRGRWTPRRLDKS